MDYVIYYQDSMYAVFRKRTNGTFFYTQVSQWYMHRKCAQNKLDKFLKSDLTSVNSVL